MATKAEMARIRRAPPPFERVEVRRTSALTPHLRRVVLGGDALGGFTIAEPAASVRIVVREPGADDLVIPEWEGNEFVYADGSRPSIRTFTPLDDDAGPDELTIDVVLHDGGVVSDWATTVEVGDAAAFSGPGRGYELDETATRLVLAGDESALPAMRQLLDRLPGDLPIDLFAEIRADDAEIPLPERDDLTVEWLVADGDPGDRLVAALGDHPVEDGTMIWAAGEAASVQRIRVLLREERGIDRSRMTVRGYWKNRD